MSQKASVMDETLSSDGWFLVGWRHIGFFWPGVSQKKSIFLKIFKIFIYLAERSLSCTVGFLLVWKGGEGDGGLAVEGRGPKQVVHDPVEHWDAAAILSSIGLTLTDGAIQTALTLAQGREQCAVPFFVGKGNLGRLTPFQLKHLLVFYLIGKTGPPRVRYFIREIFLHSSLIVRVL